MELRTLGRLVVSSILVIGTACAEDVDGGGEFGDGGVDGDGETADDDATGDDGDDDDGDGGDGTGDGAPGQCGNDTIDGDEECDGTDFGWQSCLTRGYKGGDLACTASCEIDAGACLLDTVCGDGMLSGEEDCEGDLDGETCESLGLGTGSLACGNDCRFDAAACSCKGKDESCSVDWANPGGQSNCCPPGFKGIERGACGAGSGTCS